MSLLKEETWYSSGEVAKVAGLSLRQLHYWSMIGIVWPVLEVHGLRSFHRYSNEDTELLKRIKSLKEEGCSLRAAFRKAKEEELNEQKVSLGE